jgi:hypothetical protein
MKALLGFSLLFVLAGVTANEPQLLHVEILAPDGRPVASATWPASGEIRSLAIPEENCPADASKPLSMQIQVSQPTPESISVSCSDSCEVYVVEPAWRNVEPEAALLEECTNGMSIRVRRANNSSKPTPLRGAA